MRPAPRIGTRQIDNIGSYTDTMIQFTPSDDDDEFWWRRIRPGYHNFPVECRADSGTHGDGTAGYVYARRGSELDWNEDFTSNPKSEVAWGSSPTDR